MEAKGRYLEQVRHQDLVKDSICVEPRILVRQPDLEISAPSSRKSWRFPFKCFNIG
jgi:hypothetical protein